MVIARLEQETALNREEAERTAENRIKYVVMITPLREHGMSSYP